MIHFSKETGLDGADELKLEDVLIQLLPHQVEALELMGGSCWIRQRLDDVINGS